MAKLRTAKLAQQPQNKMKEKKVRHRGNQSYYSPAWVGQKVSFVGIMRTGKYCSLLALGKRYPERGIREIYCKIYVRIGARLQNIPSYFLALLAWNEYCT